MGIKGITRFGDIVQTRTIKAFNRSGATVNKGDVLAMDLTGGETEVDTYATYIADTTPDPNASPLANLIAVGAAHDDGWILAVCLETSIADNAMGLFGIQGIFDVEVAGTSNSANGDRMTATSGQTYLSKELDGQAVCGITLETGPTGAAATKKVWFDGYSCAFGPQAEI